MRKIGLGNRQSPGDIAVMSAIPRDVHAAYPGQFQIDVRTTAEAIWENNPHITKFRDGDPDVEWIDVQYPNVHLSNQRPGHFLNAFMAFMEQKLSLRIPVTKFCGDIHLSDFEKSTPPLNGFSPPEWFWLIVVGGKEDYTASR